MLRIQFLSSKVGPFVVDTDDPIGINEITKTIKRSADNDGVIFEVIFDLDFIKASRSYLKQCFETDGGPDAVVLVNIYKDNPNTRKWVLYSEGTVNFSKYDVYEDKLSINIEQSGLQRRVINLMDTDVDLETMVSENGNALPPQLVLTDMLYHSKTITKVTESKPADPEKPTDWIETLQLNVFKQEFNANSNNVYRERLIFGQMSTEFETLKDLPENFKTPFGWRDMETIGGAEGAKTAIETRTWLLAHPEIRQPFNVHTLKEAGKLNVSLNINVKHKFDAIDPGGDINVCGTSALGTIEIYYWLEHRDSLDNIKELIYLGECDMGPCDGNDTIEGPLVNIPFEVTDIDVKIKDKIYFFHTVRIYGWYDNNAVVLDKEVWHHFYITPYEEYFFRLDSKTTAPTSTAKTILLYEALQRCCQYYTNEPDCFYSDLLGRTDIILPGDDGVTTYPIDGDAALIGITNGANLRGLKDSLGNLKQIFANLGDLVALVNSLFCVGFGFEKFADGKQRFRLERRNHFYDATNKILTLGAVYNIRKSIDIKRYYNQVEFGYSSKVDIGQTNGVDAFNTIRRNSIPIINTKAQLKVSTKVKADGYQIEAARRLKFTTEDGKNDDENFIVVVIRDGDTFKTKKDEGYELIENVVDSSTGYNYDISPARVIRNWFEVIAASLIYSKSKVLKFTFGEANFLMRTKKIGEDFIVEENGNVDLTGVVPHYDNFVYHLLDVDITDELVQEICDNPYGYIEFEDRFGNVMAGYISDGGIEHDSNKGKADFRLLKVFRL